MLNISICYLCKKEAILQESHLIPSFVGKWLKKTSITGYFRQSINPNLRKQDLLKQHLLCKDCEIMISKYEDKFFEDIFFPYVNEELDEWGIAQSKVKEIIYDE